MNPIPPYSDDEYTEPDETPMPLDGDDDSGEDTDDD